MREVAAFLYAADYAWFREHTTPEKTLAFCRAILDSADAGPWANGKHAGDCTHQPMTCARCILERWEGAAREFLSEGTEDDVPSLLALARAYRDRQSVCPKCGICFTCGRPYPEGWAHVGGDFKPAALVFDPCSLHTEGGPS